MLWAVARVMFVFAKMFGVVFGTFFLVARAFCEVARLMFTGLFTQHL